VGLQPNEFDVIKAQITRLRDTLHASAEQRASETAA
jgi:hypothetical protein